MLNMFYHFFFFFGSPKNGNNYETLQQWAVHKHKVRLCLVLPCRSKEILQIAKTTTTTKKERERESIQNFKHRKTFKVVFRVFHYAKYV